MSYELHPSQTIEESTRRVIREQLDTAVSEIDDRSLDPNRTVHQVRKRCKKIRGLLRLVRPHFEAVFRRENAWYKMVARRLSAARDAHVFLESYDDLVARYDREIDRQRYGPVREFLASCSSNPAIDEYEYHKLIDDTRSALRQGRDRIPAWERNGESSTLDMGGLVAIYAEGRRRMKKVLARPTVENLHEFRKQVRYHWYHARLLAPVWPSIMKGYNKELRFLSETLGVEHDLALVRENLEARRNGVPAKEPARLFLELLDRRVEELRTETRPSVLKLFHEKPERLADRFSCYWDSASLESD